MIIMFAIAAVCGLGIGILSGLLGVGGGTIMVPLFRLAFGMDAVVATATSLFTIIPTSISGVTQRIRNNTCLPKLGLILGISGACFSPAGVWLAQISPSWLVMFAAAIAIAYSAMTILRKALQMTSSQVVEFEPEASFLEKQSLPKMVLVGACAGLISGYIGLGGGFLIIPLMVALLHLPMRLASGTSLVAVIIIVFPATIMQLLIGNVDCLVGIAVACGSIPGAIIGARLVKRVPERALRLAFSGLLGFAAIMLVAKELVM